MTGVTALLVGGGATVGTVSLSDLDATAFNIAPSTASANYSLLSSGDRLADNVAADVWINPRVGMSGFEVRATLNSGSLTSGTTGSWLSLASSRTWTVSRSTAGAASASLFVEIRRTGGDGTILASANITLTATVS